ncbi:MAG: hypothetical protein GY851_21690, partial [bacterium]|nr:hypothetical protein [bacterium]
MPVAWRMGGGTSGDCNSNGISDDIDIAGGTSADCQLDGFPDECQIAEGPAPGPCTAPDATITIDILTDNYPSETTWELVEDGVGVVASGGPYSTPGVHEVTVVDVCADKCYTFTIFDSFGDGICCAYGNGSYEIFYEGGSVATGGVFGASETVTNIGGGCPYEPPPIPGSADCQPDGVPDECQLCGSNALISQPPNQSNGIFSDCDCDFCGSGQQVLAEQFVLTSSESIGTVRWWGGYYPDDNEGPGTDVTIIIHADAGGLPGAALHTLTGVPTTRAQTGVIAFGVHEWEFEAVLDPCIDLSAGVYWLELTETTNATTNSFFWEVGDLDAVSGLPGQAFDFACPASAWSLDSVTDMAFELLKGPCGGPPCNDCNENGVPDECDLECNDCNLNLIPDDCDIARGTSEDADSSGIPDECEERAHPGWGSEGFK